MEHSRRKVKKCLRDEKAPRMSGAKDIDGTDTAGAHCLASMLSRAASTPARWGWRVIRVLPIGAFGGLAPDQEPKGRSDVPALHQLPHRDQLSAGHTLRKAKFISKMRP